MCAGAPICLPPTCCCPRAHPTWRCSSGPTTRTARSKQIFWSTPESSERLFRGERHRSCGAFRRDAARRCRRESAAPRGREAGADAGDARGIVGLKKSGGSKWRSRAAASAIDHAMRVRWVARWSSAGSVAEIDKKLPGIGVFADPPDAVRASYLEPARSSAPGCDCSTQSACARRGRTDPRAQSARMRRVGASSRCDHRVADLRARNPVGGRFEASAPR